MRSIQHWLDEYATSHQNAVNKRLHWVCVPAIMFSLLGLLWALPVPLVLPAWANWASLTVALALVYYLWLTPRLAAGMLPVSAALLLGVYWLSLADTPVWLVSSVLFVLAWIGQFVGHHIEGRRPSFFRDVQFLLIGPLWLLAFVYRRLGLRY